MHAEQAICELDELPEGEARGFTTPSGQELVLLRWQGRLLGYRNACPHTGVNLEWFPHRFLDPEGRHLQCATHGALFRPEDGYCIWGPCAGQSLESVDLVVKDDRVFLQE